MSSADISGPPRRDVMSVTVSVIFMVGAEFKSRQERDLCYKLPKQIYCTALLHQPGMPGMSITCQSYSQFEHSVLRRDAMMSWKLLEACNGKPGENMINDHQLDVKAKYGIYGCKPYGNPR
jgi:hypothetical protein